MEGEVRPSWGDALMLRGTTLERERAPICLALVLLLGEAVPRSARERAVSSLDLMLFSCLQALQYQGCES